MPNKILFAAETIKTSQGWFSAGDLLPREDMKGDELEQLLKDKKVGECAFNSPMAQMVHDARKTGDSHRGASMLKGAMDSGVDCESPAADAPEEGATGSEEFPSLETYTSRGYEADSYDQAKQQFEERKSRGAGGDKNTSTNPNPSTATEQTLNAVGTNVPGQHDDHDDANPSGPAPTPAGEPSNG